MYFLHVWNESKNELIVLYDTQDLTELLNNYINNILDYNCENSKSPIISFDKYIYVYSNKNKNDRFIFEFRDSDLLQDYDCIVDEKAFNYVEKNCEKVNFEYQFQLNINLPIELSYFEDDEF